MSYSNQPQRLGVVLQELIDRMGIRQKLDETRAVEEWAHLAGPQLNAVTRQVWMEQGKLFVCLTSAPWRQELHLRRTEWRDRLNRQLGKPVVQEIVFR